MVAFIGVVVAIMALAEVRLLRGEPSCGFEEIVDLLDTAGAVAPSAR